MRQKARIFVHGRQARVLVDGTDFPLHGVHSMSFNASVHQPLPSLTLGIRFEQVEVAGEMQVGVDSDTWETLLSLGWTPPKDGA